jgi:hypothetical protein
MEKLTQPSLFEEDLPKTVVQARTVFPKIFKDERGIQFVLADGQRLWIATGIMRSCDKVQVHVDSDGTIYVMPTWEVQNAIRNNCCREFQVKGRVDGVFGVTGFGYIVPKVLITCSQALFTREALRENQSSSTSALGRECESLVAKHKKKVDRLSAIVLGLCASKYPEAPLSIDFVRTSNLGPDGAAILYQEVKADYKASMTPNFYFELAERNPKKLH